MDYDTNSGLVDEICNQLPNKEYQDDDPNPLHQIPKAKGIRQYYLQKSKMGEFAKSNQYSQGFTSTVNKADKKHNAVELIIHSEPGGQLKPPSADDLLKEKLTVITSALPKLANIMKDFKKTKALIMTSKNPTGTVASKKHPSFNLFFNKF